MLYANRPLSNITGMVDRFERNANFLNRFSRNTQMFNFFEIRPVPSQFDADRQTFITKNLLALRDFAKLSTSIVGFLRVFSQICERLMTCTLNYNKRILLSNRYQIITHKSFNYWIVQSDMLYGQFVNGTTNEV
jgi:hypothetical protein